MKLAHVLPLAAVALWLAACAPVPRVVDEGALDRAYERALRRARKRGADGKPRAERRLDDYLRAYGAAQDRDLRRVSALADRDDAATYPALYRRYRDLHARVVDLQAVAPPAVVAAVRPGLDPQRLASARDDARRRAGEHYLARAAPLRRRARAGDKPAARVAFALCDSAAGYLPGRSGELARVRDTLRDLGTLRIHLRAAAAEAALAEALARGRDQHRGWTSVVMRPRGARVDLEAEVRYVDHASRGPDETCSTTTYDEEVLDRVERKSVCERVDDSTTVQRVVEVEHFVTVRATITACEQSAAVRARGVVDVYEPGGRRPVRSLAISAEASWEHAYETWQGDRRALPAGCPPSGSAAWPPSRGDLLGEARADLAGAAHRALVGEYARGRSRRR